MVKLLDEISPETGENVQEPSIFLFKVVQKPHCSIYAPLPQLSPTSPKPLRKWQHVVYFHLMESQYILIDFNVLAPHKYYIGFRYADPLTEDTLEEIEK